MPKKGERCLTSGKQDNQKMKPYLVYQYLLQNSDENNRVSSVALCDYLDRLGISAERRSIYRDIDAINKIFWLLEDETRDLEDYDSEIEDCDKTIVYDGHHKDDKGFYVQYRKYEVSDIRLISELIYTSKYITQSEAERLVGIVKEFISQKQADAIRTDAIVSNRNKTLSKTVLGNIATINDAMSKKLDGEKHTPEKISFKYLKTTIENLNDPIERRKGEKYIVSPFKLIITDGNYYLLAFSDDVKAMRTYRVDRMKDIRRLGEEREGSEAFSAIDLNAYTRQTFGMYHGKKERVKMRFRDELLDTAIEKFGREKVIYSKADEEHFTVSADVEVSNQFFGWMCGFGAKAVIEGPEEVKKKFVEYIDNIRTRY